MMAWAMLLTAAVVQAGSMSARPTTIDKGAESAVETPREATARTLEEWTALWRVHAPGRPLPAVDFARTMVVGVFMGTRSTAGFGVEIVGTRQDHGSLVVEYRETRPGRDTVTAQIITAPYHLVSIPRFDGEVRFEKLTS
jgi:hypothetical protein